MKKGRVRPSLIFTILILGLIIISIPTSYIIAYTSNHNTVFGEKNVKIVKNIPDFDLVLNFVEYNKAKKEDDEIVNGRFKLKCNISNFKSDVEDLKIKYDIDIDYGKCEATSAEYKVNNGNTILEAADKSFSITHYLTVKTVFPQKPILFVKTNNPNFYVKVSYKLRKNNYGTFTTEEKTYYLKYTPSMYLESIDDYLATSTTTTTTAKPQVTTTTQKENE